VNSSQAFSRQIDPQTLAAIRERNPWDYAVYEHGKRLFEERWQAMLGSLGLVAFGQEPASPVTAAGADQVLRVKLHDELVWRYLGQRGRRQHVDYIVLLQDERDRLEAELRAAHKEARLVDAAVSEQNRYIGVLEGECERLGTEAKAKEADAVRLVRDGQEHIDALRIQLEQLAATSAEQNKHIKVLELERDRLTAEASAGQREAVRASKEGQSQIDLLKTQLDQLAATSRDQSAYIGILEKEQHRLSAELGELRQKAAHYVAVMQEQGNHIKTLQASQSGQAHVSVLSEQLECQSAEKQTQIDRLLLQLNRLASVEREQSSYITLIEKERHRLSTELCEFRCQVSRCLAVISEQKDYIRDLELTRAHRSDVRS